jgi:hypothetical protein
MKYIKSNLLFSLFCLFFLISCTGDDEPIDPALLIPAPEECNAPTFFNVSNLINGNTVRISWDKTSADEWELQYGISGFAIGSGTVVPFNITSSLISGLNATNNYDFYIRTKCDEGEFSEWIGPISPGSGLQGCSSPTNVSAVRSTTDATKVTVSWSENADGNSWQVQYGNRGFTIGTGTILAAASSPKLISNLEGNVSYDFYVRSNCEANQNSIWVGPILVNGNGIAACTTPSNLLATRSTTNSAEATLSWTAGGGENSWQIQYGIAGFTIGNGTTVNSATTTKTITGLQTTSYDFYVRAVCSTTQNSTWLGPINILAAGQTTTDYYLRMKSNGVAVSFLLENIEASYSDLSFMISALNVSGNSFNLQLFSPTGVGTYAFANPDIDAVCTFSENATIFTSLYSDFTNSPGNIVITQLDLVNNMVKGTFNFVGKDDPMTQNRVISEGEFFLPLQ